MDPWKFGDSFFCSAKNVADCRTTRKVTTHPEDSSIALGVFKGGKSWGLMGIVDGWLGSSLFEATFGFGLGIVSGWLLVFGWLLWMVVGMLIFWDLVWELVCLVLSGDT